MVSSNSTVNDIEAGFIIGLNNITSFNIVFGTVSPIGGADLTVVSRLKKVNDNYHWDWQGEEHKSTGQEVSYGWVKDVNSSTTYEELYIEINVSNGQVTSENPLYIKNISVSWSC